MIKCPHCAKYIPGVRRDKQKIIICESCGKEKIHQGRGWCAACYQRWYRVRNEAILPPMNYAERQETYFEILNMGGTREEAAKRVGITVKTGLVYERKRKNQEENRQ